jgi:hypothetical protein
MIGKGKKVRAKCPLCAKATSVSVEPATLMQQWQVYYCVSCNIKFRLPRGWKKALIERRLGKYANM